MSSVPRRARAGGRRTLLIVLCCLTALLAGCTVGPSQRPPVAVRGGDAPTLPPVSTPAPASPDELPEPEPQNSAIDFVDCTDDTLAELGTPVPAGRTLRFECGEIGVATDPAQPGLGRTRLGVLRAGTADAPDTRPPLLVLGDSDTAPSARHAARLATQVSPTVLEQYQLIGLDRRGAGTDALDCAPPAARSAVVDADPAATSEAALTALLERSRAIVQDCYLLLSGAVSSYRTSSSAADVEQIRTELGVERLAAIGVGDGAAALASWAGAHPQAVGRLVLDGPPDPAKDQPELTEARAAAAESTFDAFATACTAAGSCPLGDDPRTAVMALLDRLRSQPLVSAEGRRLTAGATVTALLAGLAEPQGWSRLGAALAQAVDGNPDGLLSVLVPVTGRDGRFDAALATSCNDARRRLTPPEVGELAAHWRTDHPLFGATLAQRLLVCAPWPALPAPAPPGQAIDAPPILVIGTAHDPRAPLAGAKRAAETLFTARFLGWQGAGTGAYPRTPCVTAVVDAMLVAGKAPQNGTLCPP
ncbi:alpha/beta fold hydrolase [Pseudonocardia sp. H11422]|uniref:alpha/beta fold hydrolase n=1 Tax=Pseudonocardia sp. H11422 TaxID=2835866 RepID=UPI001BDD310B|nr:alpha/beta fold hydrolase [Pseudonocardia sp. H11422]